MTVDLYEGLPTLATLAFEGIVPEPSPSITEADLDDPSQKTNDLADLDAMDEDEGYERHDFDPDVESYSQAEIDSESDRAQNAWERSFWGD